MPRKPNPDLDPSPAAVEATLETIARTEQTQRPGARPARKARGGWRTLAALTLNWAGLLATLGAGVVAWIWLEGFLERSPQLRLAGPPELGQESPGLEIIGQRYAQRARILDVFDQDFGRSLYRVPIRQRREELRQLEWVRDAAVSRIWPNRLRVVITERTPVAFVVLPSQGTVVLRHSLIDAEGVIMESPAGAHNFALPVMVGVRRNESLERRRRKVTRMGELLTELHDVRDRIAEIDVTSLENLKVTLQADDRALVLLLGYENFRDKVRNFLAHHAEIRERLPNATTIDLRLDGRIYVPRD